jgi:hypothetical protein
MKAFFKYLGYGLALLSAAGIIYGIGVFFANIQSSLKEVANTVSDIKQEQTDQSKKIKSIEYEVTTISTTQSQQGMFNKAIDRSYSDHLKKSKELIDEYVKYLEMQKEQEKQDEKKKTYMDSISRNALKDINVNIKRK